MVLIVAIDYHYTKHILATISLSTVYKILRQINRYLHNFRRSNISNCIYNLCHMNKLPKYYTYILILIYNPLTLKSNKTIDLEVKRSMFNIPSLQTEYTITTSLTFSMEIQHYVATIFVSSGSDFSEGLCHKQPDSGQTSSHFYNQGYPCSSFTWNRLTDKRGAYCKAVRNTLNISN